MDPTNANLRMPAPNERLHFIPIGVQIAVLLITTAITFFVLGRWSLGGLTESADLSGPALNLNRATTAELRLVPGLGDSLSQRIVESRDRHGQFRSVDELRRIPGIGPKILERIRPHLFVDSAELAPRPGQVPSPMTTSAAPMAARTSGLSKKELALTETINVNNADQATLQKLPGIGPKISQRILDERDKRPFQTIDELRRVSGIGPKTLEKLRPHVSIE